MVKRYEFDMVLVHDMGARSAEDWEQASGPVEGHRGWACLMRREVVPGRVTSPATEPKPREDVQGFQSRPPLCGRTWGANCMGATGVPHMCHDVPGHEGPCRLCGTCGAREPLSRPHVDDHRPGAAVGVLGADAGAVVAQLLDVRARERDAMGEQPDPLHNCWSCLHATGDTTGCAVHAFRVDVRWWIQGTHRNGQICPRDANGCPGWAPKATP